MRILTLATYPVEVPRHGGQVRANAIHGTLRDAGHEIRHLALYRGDEYPDEASSPWNVTFTWPFINDLIATGRRTDVSASDFLVGDGHLRSGVTKLIVEFKPDVVILEQCWLWPAWKLIASEVPSLRAVKVIYSSQNVEFALLQKSIAPGGAAVSDDVVNLVRRMELDLVNAADVVVAVSEADVAEFSKYSSKVILAPNGIWPRPEPGGMDFWRAEIGKRRNALFVGSAHPPNATGFMKMLGPSMGYLALDENVLVVGGVCNLLPRDKVFRRNLGLNLARIKLLGVQDPSGLSTLLELADIILVPITEGGGTNIKMAEALYNRKTVLCTSKAMRGYEKFEDLPFIVVRDSPEDFQDALVGLLRGHMKVRFNITRAQAQKLDGLVWSSTLSGLSAAVMALG